MSSLKMSVAAIGFCSVVALSFYLSLSYRYRLAVDEVCSIVLGNYYDLKSIQDFKLACEKTKLNFPKFLNAQETVRLLNQMLSHIQTSHLAVFDPDENLQIWFHETLDNGIRARNVSGFAVVYEVLANSPAELARIKVGDEIIAINNSDIHSVSQIDGQSGEFTIVRREHIQKFRIKAKKFEEDESLQVRNIGKEVAVLRVKSFLSPHFEAEKILSVIQKLKKSQTLIVDLRGNIGGSFPAMMRLLSQFTCRSEGVGQLHVSEKHLEAEVDLADDLSAENQLLQIHSAQKINLLTSPQKNCFHSKIWILVDHQTASVAEIFADFLQKTKRAKVAGEVTSGQVVMAEWFSLASLGLGREGVSYSLSVPIANYENFQHEVLESKGVRPNVYLYDNLEEALKGNDSWIEQILKMRHIRESQ